MVYYTIHISSILNDFIFPKKFFYPSYFYYYFLLSSSSFYLWFSYFSFLILSNSSIFLFKSSIFLFFQFPLLPEQPAAGQPEKFLTLQIQIYTLARKFCFHFELPNLYQKYEFSTRFFSPRPFSFNSRLHSQHLSNVGFNRERRRPER